MGCGEAKSKKDAQGKAAEMFCNLLVENGLLDKKELPSGAGGDQNLAATGTLSGGNVAQPLMRPPAPPLVSPPPLLQRPNLQQQPFATGKFRHKCHFSQHCMCRSTCSSPTPVQWTPLPPPAPHGCSPGPLSLFHGALSCRQLRRSA